MAQENPLSSFNVAYEIQQYVCDALNAYVGLSALNLSAYAENELQIDYLIKNALQRQGMSIVVMTPSLRLQGHDGNTNTYFIDELQVLVTEYVAINRASNKSKTATALDVGTWIAEYLAGPSSPIGFGAMSFKNIEQGEDNGLLVVKVNFKTYAQGDFGGEFEPISGKVVISPYAKARDLAELSTYTLDSIERIDETVVELSVNVEELSGQLEVFATKEYVDGKISPLSDDVGMLLTAVANLGTSVDYSVSAISELSTKQSSHSDAITVIETTIGNHNVEINNLMLSVGSLSSDMTFQKSITPQEATAQNQLADKSFVNSSIEHVAAYFITKNIQGLPFSTYQELSSATTFYNAGKERIPTTNDYTVVLSDENHDDATTRYVWQGGDYPTGQWDFQYVVNNASYTQAQWNAINSGIDSTKVQQIETNTSEIATIKTSYALSNDVKSNYMAKASYTTLTLSGEYDDATGGTFSFKLVREI